MRSELNGVGQFFRPSDKAVSKRLQLFVAQYLSKARWMFGKFLHVIVHHRSTLKGSGKGIVSHQNLLHRDHVDDAKGQQLQYFAAEILIEHAAPVLLCACTDIVQRLLRFARHEILFLLLFEALRQLLPLREVKHESFVHLRLMKIETEM